MRPKALNLKKSPSVTIAIGFLYNPPGYSPPQPSILLASDSRVSVGTTVQNDVRKIVSIQFRNGTALIAKAGVKNSSDWVVEFIEGQAASTLISSARTIPDISEQAIREAMRRLLDGYTGDKAQRLLDFDCDFIIGFHFNRTRYLYTIGLNSPLAVKCDRAFTAIGCAANLADFLLTGLEPDTLHPVQAFGMASGVIEMCKLHDAFCGGPTQLGVISETACDIFPNLTIGDFDRNGKTHNQLHKELSQRLAEQFITDANKAIERKAVSEPKK